MSHGTLILSHNQVQQKLERITWQIFEHFSDSQELTIVGIKDKGSYLAEMIQKRLGEICSIKTRLNFIQLDKNDQLPGNAVLHETTHISGKEIVLVDDVLNSGRTLLMAMKPILENNPAIVKTVILANRDHKQFPVSADIVGISLATTLQDHIAFDLDDQGQMSVWLR